MDDKMNRIQDILAKELAQNGAKSSYSMSTEGVEVEVVPEFINNQAGLLGDLYIWSYNIKIRNKSAEKLKLIRRHWKIIDEMGSIQEVDGDGVVGKQPEILAGEEFEYSSGVHLARPSGIMSGYYEMINAENEILNVKIPSFSLDVPSVKYTLN